MKYRSVNHISDFEFHDAVVKIKEYDKNNLYLYIEALNLHKDAEQNIDAKHDLEIGLATISFENIKIDNIEQPILKKAIKNTEQTIGLPATFIEKLHAGGTVLFLKDHKIGHCEIGIDFIDGGFYVANIIYDSLSIEWDDFLGPAWYVRG